MRADGPTGRGKARKKRGLCWSQRRWLLEGGGGRAGKERMSKVGERAERGRKKEGEGGGRGRHKRDSTKEIEMFTNSS